MDKHEQSCFDKIISLDEWKELSLESKCEVCEYLQGEWKSEQEEDLYPIDREV